MKTNSNEFRLINPYKYLNLSLKDFYLREIELEKTRDWIYMYYENEGKEYMKKVPIDEAIVITNDL